MRQRSGRVVVFSLMALLAVPSLARAAGSGPRSERPGATAPVLTMDPNDVTPLAGVVEFQTERPVRATLRISDGIDTRVVRFRDLQQEFALPLLGLKPDRAYEVTVSLQPGGQLATLLAVTGPLPDDFPRIQVDVSEPRQMEPGYTVLDRFGRGPGDARPRYTVILDQLGEVVWYSTIDAATVRRTPDGNLSYRSGHDAVEIDLLGNILSRTPLDVPGLTLHHELRTSSTGTLLSLSRESLTVENYPSSETDAAALPQAVEVLEEPIVEFSADGALLNEWKLADLIDVQRIGYDSLRPANAGLDWAHANAVFEDPADGSLVVSVRHQDAVVKFTREGELVWILGPHANWSATYQPYLLDPIGAPFEWQYHQHAPLVTPRGTVLLFDNGNWRASPFDGLPALNSLESYSRAVEYAIDPVQGTVQQVWEYGTHVVDRQFSGFLGDVDWLEQTSNVLITFGATSAENGQYVSDLGYGSNYARIIEVSHESDAQRVFDVRLFDPEGQITVYRSERIPSLYPQGSSWRGGNGRSTGR